ncbi:MAG: membrane protein insertase YidC [Chlamydiales bacterium]
MDKRSYIFIFSLTLALIFTNIVFTYMEQTRNKEYYDQQKAKISQEKKKTAEIIKDKTVPISKLPITQVYSSKDKQNPIARGVVTDDHLLFFSDSMNPPKEVFANQEKWTLQVPSRSDQIPSLYSKKKSSRLMTYPLSSLGIFDLQVVPLTLGQESVYLGELRDGELIFPASKIGEPIPKSPALALFSDKGKFYPVGIYSPADLTYTPLEEISAFSSHLAFAQVTSKVDEDREEGLYVIETPYQQLVFCTKGGSLCELNLPFQSSNYPKSVVKEIGIDRDIEETHPKDSFFPLKGYYTPGASPNGPHQFHEKGKKGGFYPLIRRTLSGRYNPVSPMYYALNLVSQYPELSNLNYQVTYFDDSKIVMEATQPHRKIIKTYTIAKNNGQVVPYMIDLTIKVEGDSRGMWVTSGVPEAELLSGSPSPSLKYRIVRNQKGEVESISLPQDTLTVSSTIPDWVSNSNGFLGLIMDPQTNVDAGFKAVKVPGNVVPSRIVEINEQYGKFKPSDIPGYALMLPLHNDGSTTKMRIFAGPFSERVLKQVDQVYQNQESVYNPDYVSSITYHGWFAFISRPFVKLMLFLMNLFHSLTDSWALSIILLTVVLRIILYPLNAWSMKSMAMMQQVAPELEAIKKKHKKDPKRMQIEIASLYRDRGINPFSGCFPLLIQMPFLLGMFDLLKTSFELRGATFIPGWIDNLAAPDVLFSWEQPIFFFGNEFHLLPFLLGIVMFLQQKFMTPAATLATMSDEQKQQRKIMQYMMPAIFTIMFYNVPSGLNIYWLSSMLLGIPQQWWTNKRMQKVSQETKSNEVQLSEKKGKTR